MFHLAWTEIRSRFFFAVRLRRIPKSPTLTDLNGRSRHVTSALTANQRLSKTTRRILRRRFVFFLFFFFTKISSSPAHFLVPVDGTYLAAVFQKEKKFIFLVFGSVPRRLPARSGRFD